MKCALILTTLVVAALAEVQTTKLFESEEIITFVNNVNTTWKAGHNFNLSLKLNNFSQLLGAKILEGSSLLPVKELKNRNGTFLPKQFDARTQWSYCSYVGEIHDQGACGSCWAVAAADAFTDRLCIASNGSWNKHKHMSTQDLLSCCEVCGDCTGGYLEHAWYYIQHTGIVSGGYYKSREGCRPYSLQPCEHHVHGSKRQCSDIRSTTPECKRKCFTGNILYDKDLYFAEEAYRIADVTGMQLDLIENGPITAVFRVYEDFPSYKSGVYQYTTGYQVGNLVVRLIGWGYEDGIPYWLAANSFNTDWGDEGFFKIRRGYDECGIEEYVFAGIPDLRNK